MMSNVAMRKAFAIYDKNKSGYVTKDDLVSGCKAMGVDLTDSDITQLLSRYDGKCLVERVTMCFQGGH